MANESVDKKSAFYIDEPPINADIESFFAKYASVPPSALREHLTTVRDRAWQRHTHQCLGCWRFLFPSVKLSPIYSEIVAKCIDDGATVIDFGCCLGQDIRQLVYDGVPVERIRGYELDPFFIEQGYELFRDQEIMQGKKVFAPGNILDDQLLNEIKPADYVYVGSFIHLFDVKSQPDICRRLTRIAKRAIAGRQAGAVVPGEHPRTWDSLGGKLMRHSPESFTQMWSEATNGEWQVESATLQTTNNGNDSHKGLIFVVRKRGDQ
ncbi:unnamed protein product [Adineta ricciae]|uniref:Methyltransferase domain-containing protein n=1 Tax=Adineta ricciae TaxID=249248 RepID=A0A814LQU6_ADIRI|nr:unnamed protein product [Adineta ricciae]CAF1335276.1 unnamed protein product [Adineta ricciae]